MESTGGGRARGGCVPSHFKIFCNTLPSKLMPPSLKNEAPLTKKHPSSLPIKMQEAPFLEIIPRKKKSHTCEEGGAHLRISFWHLLMNFEKPEKSEFWKNEKKLLEISSFYTCVPKTTIIWGTVPEIRSETELFAILGHFLPFYTPSLTTQKTKIFKKWKKHLEMSSF